MVSRHGTIILEAYDYDLEQTITTKLEGADSITVQHEIDHLDGILFIDKVDIKHFGDPHYKVYTRHPEGYSGLQKDNTKFKNWLNGSNIIFSFIAGYTVCH